jgi:hypothetical protein
MPNATENLSAAVSALPGKAKKQNRVQIPDGAMEPAIKAESTDGPATIPGIRSRLLKMGERCRAALATGKRFHENDKTNDDIRRGYERMAALTADQLDDASLADRVERFIPKHLLMTTYFSRQGKEVRGTVVAKEEGVTDPQKFLELVKANPETYVVARVGEMLEVEFPEEDGQSRRGRQPAKRDETVVDAFAAIAGDDNDNG